MSDLLPQNLTTLGGQVYNVTRNIGVDQPALPTKKSIEDILKIKDDAKMMSELKRLHAEWPDVETEVLKNKKTAKVFEKILGEAMLKGLTGAET